MMNTKYSNLLNSYKNKRVLITGHTGFKGTWLTYILLNAGAIVAGYSLQSSTHYSLFSLSGIEKNPNLTNIIDDIRNFEHLRKVFVEFGPEIVFHLAAQPIVREGYKNPLMTYSTNVMGTVNILECIRTVPGLKSFLNITTDKVYKNHEWEYGYRENDSLEGFDPYSNSKSCSELITNSYRNSFFYDEIGISTARAGNVIGGGDFAKDRIIPDAVKTIKSAYDLNAKDATILVRNPHSIRPYQHVLEPLFVYLLIAMMQYEDKNYEGNYNVGPDEYDCVTTGRLIELFCNIWNSSDEFFPRISWENRAEENAPHESNYLKLDCSKIKSIFEWRPQWHIDKAIEQTVNFTKVWMSGEDIENEMDREIQNYIGI